MKRSTKSKLARIKRNVKTITLFSATLTMEAYLVTAYFKVSDVEVSKKGLNCAKGICNLTIELKNNTALSQSGYLNLNLSKKERASSNMGLNDGYVHRIYFNKKLVFEIEANSKAVLDTPYSHTYLSPMIAVQVVLDEEKI